MLNNWSVGKNKKREIELNNVKPFDLSCMTMDEQWIIIGLKESGDIVVFCRLTLKPQDVKFFYYQAINK